MQSDHDRSSSRVRKAGSMPLLAKAAALAIASIMALQGTALGSNWDRYGRSSCDSGWGRSSHRSHYQGVRFDNRSRSSGVRLSVNLGSGSYGHYSSRSSNWCPPPIRTTHIVTHRPVVYSTPVVYSSPVVYAPLPVVVVERPRVVETVRVVESPRVIEQVRYVEPVRVAEPARVVRSSTVVVERSSASDDLTRALVALNAAEDRRGIELFRAYFRTYESVPNGLVLSRPMLERLEGVYELRCQDEEPSADNYFVLALLRGLLGEREQGLAALDAANAWGDRDPSADQLRLWLEGR